MVRKEVHQSVTTNQSDDQPVQATRRLTEEEQDASDYDALNPYLRFCWQYSGLVLGLIGIVGLLWPVFKYDPDIELHPMHNIGWTVVIVIAFIIHSTRPFQCTDSVTFDDISQYQQPVPKKDE